MNFGVNQVKKSSTGVGSAGGKSIKQAAKEAQQAASGPVGDALAITTRWEAPPTTAQQLAEEFKQKHEALNAPGPDSDMDPEVRANYLIVETVVKLMRDTQAEPFNERKKTLDVVDKVCHLPRAMRGAIVTDLKHTSAG